MFSGLSVCGVNVGMNITNILNLLLIISGIFWLIKNKIKIDTYFFIVVIGIFIPNLISVFSSYINIFFNGNEYQNYFFIVSIGRKINIIGSFLIFSYLNAYINKKNKKVLIKMLKSYILGTFIIFIFFGIWQLLHEYLDIPMFTLKSRSYIHSAGQVASFLKIRMTGLANEPSYIAPYLIDSMILSWILRSKKLLFLNFFALLFTYSGGGYVNIGILILIYIFYPRIINLKKRIKIIKSFVIIFILIFIFNFKKIFVILSPVINRFHSESNMFNIEYNIRVYMIMMPFFWILQENTISTLFGMGPGSFKYLNLIKYFKGNSLNSATSNNIFSDFVYETGYIGLFLLILMFYNLLKKLNLKLKIKKNRYSRGNILLVFHLIISSLYRGDFFSSRFWIILIIIKINILLNKK